MSKQTQGGHPARSCAVAASSEQRAARDAGTRGACGMRVEGGRASLCASCRGSGRAATILSKTPANKPSKARQHPHLIQRPTCHILSRAPAHAGNKARQVRRQQTGGGGGGGGGHPVLVADDGAVADVVAYLELQRALLALASATCRQDEGIPHVRHALAVASAQRLATWLA